MRFINNYLNVFYIILYYINNIIIINHPNNMSFIEYSDYNCDKQDKIDLKKEKNKNKLALKHKKLKIKTEKKFKKHREKEQKQINKLKAKQDKIQLKIQLKIDFENSKKTLEGRIKYKNIKKKKNHSIVEQRTHVNELFFQ